MIVNQYTQPINALFANTYVPIDFGTLFNITQQLQQMVDLARQDIGEKVSKLGTFSSPSQKDMQNYYNITLGRKDIADEILKMATDADYIKDAANRNKFMGLLNTIDYLNVAKLREGAEALRQRQKSVADLTAQGRYRKQQDLLDINSYDTMNNGVLTELSPTPYVNYKLLTDQYFNQLKPSDLGLVRKNGVTYNRQGIDQNVLLLIAKANLGNIILTPQGLIYYNELLQLNNGDKQAAAQLMINNIVGSLQERLVHQDEVDPLWMLRAKASMANSQRTQIKDTPASRLDFINKTVYDNAFGSIGKETTGWLKEHIPYAQSLIKRYPNSYIGIQAKKDLDKLQSVLKNRYITKQNVDKFAQLYNATGDQRYLIKAMQQLDRFTNIDNQLMSISAKPVMEREFKRVAGFYPRDIKNKDKFSQEGYSKGINSALDMIKGTITINDNDKLMTGGQFVKIKDETGIEKKAYQFPTSSGFILPETAFNIMTENNPREAKRNAILMSDKFPLKDIIEQGLLNDVQFFPDSEKNVLKTGNNLLISGKLRVYKDDLEKHLSDRSAWEWTLGIPTAGMIMSEDTEDAIKRIFGGRKVKENNTKDGETYYEVPALRVLPDEKKNSEFWQTQLQHWQGGKGIGGTKQASEAYGISQELVLE